MGPQIAEAETDKQVLPLPLRDTQGQRQDDSSFGSCRILRQTWLMAIPPKAKRMGKHSRV